MKSIHFKAAIAAAAAMVAAQSFANGGNTKFFTDPQQPSTLSRAEVRAELQESRREGYRFTIDNSYPGKTVAVSRQAKTRAEVRAEVAAGGPMGDEERALYSH